MLFLHSLNVNIHGNICGSLFEASINLGKWKILKETET